MQAVIYYSILVCNIVMSKINNFYPFGVMQGLYLTNIFSMQQFRKAKLKNELPIKKNSLLDGQNHSHTWPISQVPDPNETSGNYWKFKVDV